jgi:NADP-dependent 3-hydroxy acid dehydrogenase YdfG
LNNSEFHPSFPDFTQHVALVTGASSGIGRAVAEKLLLAGAKVIGLARRKDKLEQLEKFSPSFYPIELDIQHTETVAQVMDALPQPFRSISILVNNAGLALGRVPFTEGSPGDWTTMFQTNVAGVLAITAAVLPLMQADTNRIKGKYIINIGSLAAKSPYPGGNVYCATKAAVDAFTQNLRIDLVGSGIRVGVVHPGMVQTEFSEVRYYGDTEKAKTVYAGFHPLYAADVADLVMYILSTPLHVQIADVVILPRAQASSTNVDKLNDLIYD